ncbi:MAG: ATP synthase F0 subunit B [Nitrospinota bacterium]|jgi:F-type H+-transporting ATPase subunit b
MLEFNVSFFIQLINFLILILLLHLLLFKPILKNLKRRNEMVGSLKEGTDSLNKKVDKIVGDYNTNIANVKKESVEMINKAKAEATVEQNRIISEAKEDFKTMVDDAKAQIQAETEKASAKLREDVEPISRILVKKILGREVN